FMQVNQDAQTFFCDRLKGMPYKTAAVAGGGSEDVAVHAARMHAHQHSFGSCHFSAHQRQVILGVEIAGVSDSAKLSVFGLHAAFGYAPHELLVLEAIADDLGHRDHFQAVADAEVLQLRDARHGAVVVHDFADHTGGGEAGHAGQVHRRLGLAGAHQH